MSASILKEECSKFKSLYDVLCKYTGNSDYDKILKYLQSDNSLWMMAEQNNVTEQFMYEWVLEHLSASIKCSVFKELSNSGIWPIVKIECLNMTFFMDWGQ